MLEGTVNISRLCEANFVLVYEMAANYAILLILSCSCQPYRQNFATWPIYQAVK